MGEINFFMGIRKHANPSVVSGNQYLFSYRVWAHRWRRSTGRTSNNNSSNTEANKKNLEGAKEKEEETEEEDKQGEQEEEVWR